MSLTEWPLDMFRFTMQKGMCVICPVGLALEKFKIMDVSDTCIKQRAVNAFLTAEFAILHCARFEI